MGRSQTRHARAGGDEVTGLEVWLAELGGRRPTIRAQARAELADEGLPVVARHGDPSTQRFWS